MHQATPIALPRIKHRSPACRHENNNAECLQASTLCLLGCFNVRGSVACIMHHYKYSNIRERGMDAKGSRKTAHGEAARGGGQGGFLSRSHDPSWSTWKRLRRRLGLRSCPRRSCRSSMLPCLNVFLMINPRTVRSKSSPMEIETAFSMAGLAPHGTCDGAGNSFPGEQHNGTKRCRTTPSSVHVLCSQL